MFSLVFFGEISSLMKNSIWIIMIYMGRWTKKLSLQNLSFKICMSMKNPNKVIIQENLMISYYLDIKY
jgi:hypothetical protein